MDIQITSSAFFTFTFALPIQNKLHSFSSKQAKDNQQYLVVMELTPESNDRSINGVKMLVRKSNYRNIENKCNQCDFASSYASALRRHLKTHSGEKLNKCNQCDYASSLAHNLRVHLKTHSGEKANKCNQSDFASLQAIDLRRHLTTHSGEKSNRCYQCDYASSQAGHLRRHLKTHSRTK